MELTTNEVAAFLGISAGKIINAKHDNRHKLIEGKHWSHRYYSNGTYVLVWHSLGIKWLEEKFKVVTLPNGKCCRKGSHEYDSYKWEWWNARRDEFTANFSKSDEVELYQLAVPPIETRSELLDKLRDLKLKGYNKRQCILTLWNLKKGGGRRYQNASFLYDQLMKELNLRRCGDCWFTQ